MKKNRFSGKLQVYNDLTNDQAGLIKTKRKNRFSGSFDRYNKDQPNNADKNETLTANQKKILGEGLEQLKNTIIGAISGINPGQNKNETAEEKKQRLKNEFLASRGYGWGF